MKKILWRTLLSETMLWKTTLTQSSDWEYLYFTATIYWWRNYKFGKIKLWDSRIKNFHQNIISEIREEESKIKKEYENNI